jgi:hypothetical protein
MRKNCFIGLMFVTTCILDGSAFARPQQQTWTGYVTDTHCGTNCQVTKAMTPDVKCIRRCVKKGSKYGLWSGNKVYVLEPQTNAAQFAAKNVKVKGTMTAETIHIATIEPVEAPADSNSKH